MNLVHELDGMSVTVTVTGGSSFRSEALRRHLTHPSPHTMTVTSRRVRATAPEEPGVYLGRPKPLTLLVFEGGPGVGRPPEPAGATKHTQVQALAAPNAELCRDSHSRTSWHTQHPDICNSMCMPQAPPTGCQQEKSHWEPPPTPARSLRPLPLTLTLRRPPSWQQ